MRVGLANGDEAGMKSEVLQHLDDAVVALGENVAADVDARMGMIWVVGELGAHLAHAAVATKRVVGNHRNVAQN